MARLLLGLALAALALPASGVVARPSGGTPVALVTAETENEVIAVSFPDGKVLRRVHVAADPQNVVANQKVAVVISPGSGTVTLLDARTLRVEKVLGGFGAPHLATLTPDGKWAYVTDDPRGQLDVVSLTQKRVVKRLYVGIGAHHLSLWGSRLWIALGEHARQITIVDVSKRARPRVLRRFTPGFVAHDLSFNENGSRIWVTSSEDGFVRVFDAHTGRRLFSVEAGPSPQHVLFAGHYAYITSGYASRIEQVDASDGNVVAIGKVPYGSFNLAATGSFLFTASLLTGKVTELSRTLRVWKSVAVAPATRGVAMVVWPSY